MRSVRVTAVQPLEEDRLDDDPPGAEAERSSVCLLKKDIPLFDLRAELRNQGVLKELFGSDGNVSFDFVVYKKGLTDAQEKEFSVEEVAAMDDPTEGATKATRVHQVGPAVKHDHSFPVEYHSTHDIGNVAAGATMRHRDATVDDTGPRCDAGTMKVYYFQTTGVLQPVFTPAAAVSTIRVRRRLTYEQQKARDAARAVTRLGRGAGTQTDSTVANVPPSESVTVPCTFNGTTSLLDQACEVQQEAVLLSTPLSVGKGAEEEGEGADTGCQQKSPPLVEAIETLLAELFSHVDCEGDNGGLLPLRQVVEVLEEAIGPDAAATTLLALLRDKDGPVMDGIVSLKDLVYFFECHPLPDLDASPPPSPTGTPRDVDAEAVDQHELNRMAIFDQFQLASQGLEYVDLGTFAAVLRPYLPEERAVTDMDLADWIEGTDKGHTDLSWKFVEYFKEKAQKISMGIIPDGGPPLSLNVWDVIALLDLATAGTFAPLPPKPAVTQTLPAQKVAQKVSRPDTKQGTDSKKVGTKKGPPGQRRSTPCAARGNGRVMPAAAPAHLASRDHVSTAGDFVPGAAVVLEADAHADVEQGRTDRVYRGMSMLHLRDDVNPDCDAPAQLTSVSVKKLVEGECTLDVDSALDYVLDKHRNQVEDELVKAQQWVTAHYGRYSSSDFSRASQPIFTLLSHFSAVCNMCPDTRTSIVSNNVRASKTSPRVGDRRSFRNPFRNEVKWRRKHTYDRPALVTSAIEAHIKTKTHQTLRNHALAQTQNFFENPHLL